MVNASAIPDLRDRFLLALAEHVGDELGMDIYRKIETGVYNWALECATRNAVPKTWAHRGFRSIYCQKARSVVSNLVPDILGNTALIEAISAARVEPHRVAYMTPEEMHPDKWKRVLDMKTQKEQSIFQKPESMTDQFKCSKCKKRECVYQEVQLRSCDEPVSLFITCLNCGHKWRVG